MKLVKYIENHYNGNVSAFASANSIAQPQVWRMVSKGAHYVFDGELYQVKRKLIKKVVGGE